MKKLNMCSIDVKKSKFIGILYEVNSVDEVNIILNDLKKEHKKAKHIVYAYKIGTLERSNKDNEPSGTTRGVYNIINIKNKDNILIVVIRYFGGILLGSNLLTRTYTKVASSLFVK